MGRATKTLQKSLFFGKAFLPFALTFSFVVLPIAHSEGANQISQPKTDTNSQNLKLLKVLSSPESASASSGSEIMVERSALLAIAPTSSSKVNPNKNSAQASMDEIGVYIVKEGDTLSEIAEMFGVKTSTVRGFNNIRKDSDLKPGQELLILPVDGVVYKVEKGDTLSSVAKKFKSDEMDISIFNDISSDGKLTVGEDIIIPNAEPLVVVEEVKKTVAKTGSGTSKSSSSKSGGNTNGSSYPSGFYTHPIPNGAVKSQGFHDKFQAQDLAASTGTKIVASSAGRVISAKPSGYNGGYGLMVIIDDGRANVLYAHMSEVLVTQGQTIAQGQVIGLVGSTGRSTGPHLHIEYRGKNGPMKTPTW